MTDAEVASYKLEFWGQWGKRPACERDWFTSEQVVMGSFLLLESCGWSPDQIDSLFEKIGDPLSGVNLAPLIEEVAEKVEQHGGKVDHSALPWPQEEFGFWLAPKAYCTSRPKRTVVKILQAHRQWIMNEDSFSPEDKERAYKVMTGCLYTIWAAGKPPLETERWIGRNDFRRIFRKIKERFATQRGRRALRRLIELAISTVEACAWKKRVSIGDLPEADAHGSKGRKRRARTEAERQAISDAMAGRPKSDSHREAISQAARGKAKSPAHRRALSESAKRQLQEVGSK